MTRDVTDSVSCLSGKCGSVSPLVAESSSELVPAPAAAPPSTTSPEGETQLLCQVRGRASLCEGSQDPPGGWGRLKIFGVDRKYLYLRR